MYLHIELLLFFSSGNRKGNRRKSKLMACWNGSWGSRLLLQLLSRIAGRYDWIPLWGQVAQGCGPPSLRYDSWRDDPAADLRPPTPTLLQQTPPHHPSRTTWKKTSWMWRTRLRVRSLNSQIPQPPSKDHLTS